ncbi:MAG TPA: hypothetical protein VHC20_02335 [Candidatus Paceibacterota bacterium]|nr:hypothetical protein [Candidatus Paceibacterota bacterium]
MDNGSKEEQPGPLAGQDDKKNAAPSGTTPQSVPTPDYQEKVGRITRLWQEDRL